MVRAPVHVLTLLLALLLCAPLAWAATGDSDIAFSVAPEMRVSFGLVVTGGVLSLFGRRRART